MYPNPFTESATINFKNNGYIYTLQLFDVSGNIIETHETTGTMFTIERGTLPSGMYLYSVQNSTRSERYMGRLVVE